MPLKDTQQQVVDAQQDFSGGMIDMPGTPPNTYRFGRNIEIRNGRAVTRRGVRATYQKYTGVTVGFYFNQENKEYTDATHTGFWFPFQFAKSIFAGRVQGAAVVKHSSWPDHRFIVCVGGVIFTITDVVAKGIGTVEEIEDTEDVYFVQAANKVYLFRGSDKAPMVWDFGAQGFQYIPSPGVKVEATGTEGEDDYVAPIYWDEAPSGRTPIYHLGRLWVWVNDDEVVASDILDFNNWDTALRRYAISYGDGDVGTALHPIGRNEILACKKRSISILSNLNDPDLENIARYNLSSNIGVVGERAIVSDGSQAWFMAYDGIYYMFRNEYGQLQIGNTPISLPVKSLIDRINWDLSDGICAGLHENYVMFGVPLDGADHNNAIIVYDRQLGVFVGVWDGLMITPSMFLAKDRTMHFVTKDGLIKTMFAETYADSLSPADDFPNYDPDQVYTEGMIVADANGDLKRCLQRNRYYNSDTQTEDTIGTDNTDYWEAVTDAWPDVQITTEIITRNLNHADVATDKHASVCELVYGHLSPTVSVEFLDEDPHGDAVIHSGITYDRTKYTVIGKDDWDQTNDNLDFNTPDREDYDLFLTSDGFYMGDSGITFWDLEGSSLRWIPFRVNERSCAYRVTSTTGKVEIRALVVLGTMTKFASRER